MGALVVAPLAGWNVRGYSYGERQADGQLHTGADLNVGAGDDDRGLPVGAFADGTVVYRGAWDGASYGYGNYGLVEHRFGQALTPPLSQGEREVGLRLWSLYAHLDGFDDAFVVGEQVAAGQRIGACGKSGRQEWAHLHFELRYLGPPEMEAWYWGGRLTLEQLGERYADPFTLMRVLSALANGPEMDAGAYAALEADRNYNFRLKMSMEGELRRLEEKRRLKLGTVARLIAAV